MSHLPEIDGATDDAEHKGGGGHHQRRCQATRLPALPHQRLLKSSVVFLLLLPEPEFKRIDTGVSLFLPGVGLGQRVTQGHHLLVCSLAFGLELIKLLLQFGALLLIPATDAFEIILQTTYLSKQRLFFQPRGRQLALMLGLQAGQPSKQTLLFLPNGGQAVFDLGLQAGYLPKQILPFLPGIGQVTFNPGLQTGQLSTQGLPFQSRGGQILFDFLAQIIQSP